MPDLEVEEITPLEVEEITPPKQEKKRPSNIGKQALAGITDIGTGIPSVLGLAGSGLQAGFNTLTGDKPFMENFREAASTGIDASLLKTGMSGRKAVNEFLGIEEPVSTEDQIARLASALIPIPGIRVAKGASLLPKLAGNTFNVLTPAVKFGEKGARLSKPFFARAGTQVAAGLGIDQGIRAVQGDPKFPLMLSDAAISGIPQVPDLEVEEIPEVVPDDSIFIEGKDGFEARRELDKKVQKQEDWENIQTWAAIAAAATGSYAAMKWAQRIALKKADEVAPFGSAEPVRSGPEQFASDLDKAHLREYPGVLNQGRKDALEFLGESMVDRSKALANTLRQMGHTKENIDHIVANSHIDTAGMAQNVMETGSFGQGFTKTTHAIRDLEVEHAALGDRKAIFDRAMLAQTEKASRINESPTSLWGSQRSTQELDTMISTGRADPEVSALMDKFSEVFDTHLEYQVHRRLITETEANAFRGKFTNPDGSLAYMPLYSASRKTFMNRMARRFGIHTGRAKELDIMGEFHTRGPDGIAKPLGPMEALRQYTIHSIDNANTSAFHMQALSNLSGVQITHAGHTRFILDANGHPTSITNPRIDHTGRGTTYLGKGIIDDQTDAVDIKLVSDLPQGSKQFRNGSVNDIRQQAPNEIITVQHEGQLHAFHVPDASIRAALDLNPQLGSALQFMNHYKRLFTRFTTGDLSLFAPISHMFSSQQVALATAGREGVKEGIKSVGHSLSGSKEIFLANSAKEIAQFLSHRIATNTGIGRVAPQASESIRNALEKRFRNSLLNDVRGETGRISSSLQADTFTGSVADFADSVGRNFGQKFGQDQMGLSWRLWKTWNNALHEGPAFGAMMKKIGEARNAGKVIDDRAIREAVDFSKSVAGDMRRLGASGMARAFNSSVPFSAAMIQSWNALGSAAKYNWKEFSLGVGTLIGVPTVSELVYNAMLSREGTTFPDANGKEWTYDDYYWNGFTTQQRTDNMIMFVPGKPPWEAIVMPVSPEFGLFRGAVIESMDVLFNLSQTGAIGETDKERGKVGRDQFLGSLARVLDIPTPPLVAALFSSQGIDLRFGLAIDKSDDPDDPGQTLSFMRGVPLGQGERVTRRTGRAKFAQSSLDTDTVAMLQDIFGSGAALYVAVHEAMFSEKKQKPESIGDRASLATDAFADGLRRQARWTQPLFGKTLRPNANDEIARDLFNRREALKRLGNDFNSYFSGGQVDTKGNPSVGNTDVPPDDPINFELAGDAKTVIANIGLLDKDIAALRTQISKMGLATNLGSIRERNDKIDAKVLEIQALKARQLSSILDYEARASTILSDRYGRTINIDLATFKPRANLPASSIGQELRKSLPSSQ